MRVEHEDQANSHGRAVGANMAGADEPYTHLPFFYSDLFELGYEAVGEVDSRRDTWPTGSSRSGRASSPISTRRAAARVPARRRVGEGRRRDRADRGRRAVSEEALRGLLG